EHAALARPQKSHARLPPCAARQRRCFLLRHRLTVVAVVQKKIKLEIGDVADDLE
ncbi:hypothetical protein BHM03_00055012, partial [Ensete ventricosum]